ASYNMRKAMGTDRRRDPRRTIDVLRELNADVIALQEADRRFGSRMSALPPDLLAEHSPYRPVPFDVRPGGIGWHGNALLVRESTEILDWAVLDLPAFEPRGAVMADLRIDGVALRIVGMHLDLSGLVRRRQARAVIAHVEARRPQLPTVLMGDLNEWMARGGCLREFLFHYRVAPTGRSFHSRRPVARLDRIIVSPELTLRACGVHHSSAAARASDHLPIWARIAPAA
ncbi:MAG TPA: endonuclease/exonuclease/phosphatase family protein, partial [Sphingomonadaceae bacterium]|nr:endonuclease/exonuclease/phosphatase family protein [Sphingomonadaceae bacterium]